MTADILMLFIYLLIHFIVVSLAVFIGLWLYYATEWVMDKFFQKPKARGLHRPDAYANTLADHFDGSFDGQKD